MSKRTLSLVGAGVALVTLVGVTTALAGSAGRKEPAPAPAVASKPSPAATKASRANATAGAVESTVQSTKAGSYWTPERMKQAEAPAMSIPGGRANAASSAGPTPKDATPAAARKARQKTTTSSVSPKTRTSKTSQTSSGAVTGDATDNAAAYWTEDRMADATAPDVTVPGGTEVPGPEDPDIRGAGAP